MDKNIGVSSQSCHKVLKISMRLEFKVLPTITPDIENFNAVAQKRYYFEYILARLNELQQACSILNYNSIEEIYFDAKKLILGIFSSKQKLKIISPD